VIVFQADNSLASKQLEGRKQNKERITFAICCNGDGSNRLSLWVIGKYKNPRFFENINKNTLGCQYRNNSNAWMMWEIFLEWFRGFDLHVSGRKVLLIMDNFSGHIPLDQLPNHIQLRNTTQFSTCPQTQPQGSNHAMLRSFVASRRTIIVASTDFFCSAWRIMSPTLRRSTSSVPFRWSFEPGHTK
jgi:hypothetical protein